MFGFESLFEGIDFSESLTRAQFEELNLDLFHKTLGPVAKVLEDAGVKKSEVEEIILVGGSARIPKVQQLLRDFFDGKEPSPYPNPDEAVVHGAALQGYILNSWEGVGFLAFTPLSLGVQTVRGLMATIIARNTVLPTLTKKAEVFSTAYDNQEAVSIQVFAGERTLCKDNHKLGEFNFRGISPAPRGVPQIEVSFEIEDYDIIQVSAKDMASQRQESISFTSTGLCISEEERMVEEAWENWEGDKEVHERIKAYNGLEFYAYSLKNMLSNTDVGVAKVISDDDQDTLEEKLAEILDWLDENEEATKEACEGKREELEEVTNPMIPNTFIQNAYTTPTAEGEGGEAEIEGTCRFFSPLLVPLLARTQKVPQLLPRSQPRLLEC